MPDFKIKRSYEDFPSIQEDGTVYVSRSSINSSGTVSTGPDYSVRIGSETGLQLDRDKTYTVDNQTYTPSPSAGGIGRFSGSISGLEEYFDGLKIIFNLSLFRGSDDSATIRINSLDWKNIFDSNGEYIDVTYIQSIGNAILQYSSSIPLGGDTENLVDGFQVVNYTMNPQTFGDISYLKLIGGTMKGAIDMRNYKISRVPDPEADTDAVNKRYVDSLVDDVHSSVSGCTSSDVTLDNLDGSLSANYARIERFFYGKDHITRHESVGFGTPMQKNSCVHVFVYCPVHTSIDPGVVSPIPEVPVTPNTYSDNSELQYNPEIPRNYILIPHHLCGGKMASDTPTQYDYTWINGVPGYVGPNGSADGSPVIGDDVYFYIPDSGFLEISIYYNEVTVNGQVYTRTVIKCDGERATITI